MKLLLLLAPLFLLADSFILHSEPAGNLYTVVTLCKDGYRYTLIESAKGSTLTQDFALSNGKLLPIECPLDFKHPSQLAKD